MDLLLPGINQRLDGNKHATSDMHTYLKGDLQTVIAQNGQMSMKIIEVTVKNSVSSTFSKLGRCMATLDANMESKNEDIGNESNISEEESSPTNLPSPSLETEDEVHCVPSKFVSVQSMVAHWETYVNEIEKIHSHKWRRHLSKGETKRFTRMKRIGKAFKAEVAKGLDNYAWAHCIPYSFPSMHMLCVSVESIQPTYVG